VDASTIHNAGNQKAGYNEEDANADKTSGDPERRNMESNRRENGDRSQAIDVGLILWM
jgi:hypothetical protein